MDQGLGVLVWSPLAGGLLSGKYRRNHQAPVGSRQLSDWGEPPVYDQDGLYDIVELLIAIGAEHGVSAAQVALAWTLGRPAVTSLVIGARTAEQLADNLAAADLTSSGDERARLDKASAPAAHLPLLAPGQDRPRPALARRPDPARPAPGLTAGCSARCPATTASPPASWTALAGSPKNTIPARAPTSGSMLRNDPAITGGTRLCP